MDFHSHSLLLKQSEQEYIQSKISNINSKQILSQFIHNRLKHPRKPCSPYLIRNHDRNRRRRRVPVTFDVTHQSKNSNEIKNQLNLNKNKINNELLKPIENMEQEENHLNNSHEQINEQQAQLQRAIYNAKQTPLIPFIVDIDYHSLFDLSQQQNDLLTNILSLVHNVNEECSFFEQFRI